MKKIFMIVFVIVLSISYDKTETALAQGFKDKTPKILYRDPDRFKGKWVPYKITSITYHTYFKEETSSNEYGISIKGEANGKNATPIYYKTTSIEEIQYYQRVFNGDYKQIRLYHYVHGHKKCGKKKCETNGIIVEF